MKFDEFTIAEHDKTRGTRQKIDEPKTPYEVGQEDEVFSSTAHDVEMRMHDESGNSMQVDEEIKMHL